jgi:integrase
MKAKPLSTEEVSKILGELKTPRDKTLFILAVRTGLRISELLSLRVGDVRQHGRIRETVSVQRRNVKGKHESRTVILHDEAKRSLESHISGMHDGSKLFPVTRQHAWRLIKAAAERAEIAGNVSPGSTRKAFARRVYEALNRDIKGLQKALGHKNMSSTGHYLEADQEAVDAAILAA